MLSRVVVVLSNEKTTQKSETFFAEKLWGGREKLGILRRTIINLSNIFKPKNAKFVRLQKGLRGPKLVWGKKSNFLSAFLCSKIFVFLPKKLIFQFFRRLQCRRFQYNST